MGNLSPEKQALLVLQMKKKKAAEAAAARVAAVGMPRRPDPSAPVPLSFAQQRLWLLDRLDPGTSAYNIPAQARLRGRIDVHALELAIGEILRRHDALRTRFAEQDAQPAQVIAPPSVFHLPVADLAGLPEGLRQTEEQRLLLACIRPFDLNSGPLFRATLLRLGAVEHLLLLDMHHIVSDGWSLGVFFRELAALYEAFHAGRAPSLPELPVQYPDFAVWQREWLQGPVLEEQLGYWRERLAGAPPELELPLDRVRPAVQTHRGRTAHADLPAGLVARLRELSLAEGATPFMTFLAAFQLLLSRLSGQDDVVVGSPSAGRVRGEVEGLIGLFLNTLVLRTDLSGDPTFRELLGRARETVLGAYRYQAIPFERLLEELQPERLLSRTPIFQVLFNFVTLSDLQIRLPGVEVDVIDPAKAESKFDFTLYVNELPDSLRFDLVYNADLFEPERMAELLRQLEHLLAQAAADPDRRIGEMSLVTPSAVALLPDPAQPLPGDWRGPIHEALSRNAAEQPERIAVQDAQGTVWTYAELEVRANRLAHRLIAGGVEKGDAVAVWAHRSAPLVQALMGTLKAGAAFMVLDPAYPVPRLLDYLRIGRPMGWIAVPGAPPPPAEVAEAVSVLCQVDLADLSGSETDPGVPIGPDDAACLTFTSGSTGLPKGVVGRHGPLTHFYPWMAERFGLGADDRFGMLSALSHDPLQRDVFTPVWFGARMVLPDPERIGAPGYLAGWLHSEQVTVLHLTPAMMEMVLDSTENGPEPIRELPDLRRAFVVGDLLKKGDVEHLQEIAPSVVCVNLYGSTETQRSVSFFEVPRETARLGKEVLPLGRGMEGCQLLVLNRGGRLAGVGESGEIHMRSRHLARGYLGDEELTAKRFLSNPQDAGDRVYKTGDLGRYLPDGGVEMLGRVDFQVKLRGFRIELGEVEAALARYPGVRECVVIAREDRPGDRRLVGYLVGAPDLRDLRGFLGSRLPDYMVPSAFVVLPSLPLTRTGKVDRKALPPPPPPVEEQREAGRAVEKSAVEELLSGIWAELLGVADVSPHQNFFELGGHSLLATRMISRVRAVLGVELPLRSVFEEPTLSGFAALVERARLGDAAPMPPLVRVPRGGLLPASFAQQRLWFLERLEPRSFAYHLTGGVRLSGALDAAALEASLAGIVRRHESLRTAFADVEGVPWQTIAEPAPLLLPVLDLSGLPEERREPEVLRITAAVARWPYDLGRGPLVRTALLRLGGREHALIVGMHHIVSDGWSMSVFVRELSALYRDETLPELAIQYADFAVWQRQWLSGEVMEERLGWWKDQLAGAPQVIDLPLDRPRPAVQTSRGGRAQLLLEHGLEALGRRLGATPFMILLAAWSALLRRHGGQDDVVVGTPIANRERAELEGVIGFFANTLALRVDLSGDPTAGELTRRIRDTALGAYARQDVPFERLVDELRPQRSLSFSPVFQVMLALQNLPAAELDLAGLALSPLELDNARTQFDLSLFLRPQPGGLLAQLVYARDLFDAETAGRMLDHFQRLLARMAADGGDALRISELPLLADEEREQVLRRWNDTATAYPRHATVHGLFEEQAWLRPETLAVVGANEQVTYAELDRRANQVAARLLAAGVRPDEAVGLCAERSCDLIAALLGILKAGGAYVPLDPDYPQPRLAAMLEDTGARFVLVQEGLEASLPDTDAIRLPLRAAPAALPAALPEVQPEQLAYVVFTSGSTGRPKGVAVTHRCVVRLVRDTDHTPVGPDEVFLQLAPVSFDASTLEIWGPLLNGGGVALFPPGPPDLREIGEAVARHGVTALFLTAGLFHQMVESHLESLRPLRQLTAGGDVLSPAHVRRVLAGLPGVAMVNAYGPTENTTYTTAYPMRSENDAGTGSVPIGGPIANSRVYLLDAAFQPVPVGVVGRLYAAGDGLARGYARRPDLTAERFVPDSVSGEAGARLYDTGDLARWRVSGDLEFVGRADTQVKLRGFRIEPGEIEATLSAHPDVDTAVVLAREDTPGDKRLAAYLVPAVGRSPVPAELRAWLGARLPSYMVPAAFVLLPALPLSPTGKVDRRRLPVPAGERRETGRPEVERNPLEELLAGIWCDLLGVPDVAPEDSFFDLGGHSLLATRMISQVRSVLGMELPLRALFEEPTLAGFAALAERAWQGEAESAAPPLARAPRGVPLPASFSQQRLWFLDQLEPGSFAYNLTGAVRLEGPLDVAALAGALSGIVRRHESLRTTFVNAEGEPRQVIAEPAALPLPVFDLAGLPAAAREAEVLRIAGAEARRPYDLARGPLVRTTLLRLGEREHVFLLGMHHIVSDGWSLSVFVRELGALYRCEALPELPVQYADFAAWQRQWLTGAVLEERIAWWKSRLAGAPQVIDLPLDRPRPTVQTYRGGRAALALGGELAARLEALGRRLGVTPFMLLLAGFSTLLRRYGSQADVVIGVPIANRERAELENLIGFFANTLALRVELSGASSLGDLVRRIREVTLGAYAHQDVPFERLVDELRPERSLSHSPVFQVALALQNLPPPEMDLAGLTLSPLELESGRTQFDLGLFLTPRPGGGGLLAQLDYARDLFDASTARRLLGHFQRLLEGMTEKGGDESRLSELPLLTEAEHEQVVRQWNETATSFPRHATVHGLFAEQVRLRPDAVAVVGADEQLTYAELDRRADQVAARLLAAGVRPDEAVGYCAERSCDLIVALLGILKAGGAYVPLDPDYPQPRLAAMLEDSGARFVLVQEGLDASLPDTGAIRLPLRAAPVALPAAWPEVRSDHLAYVLFTSGSTGRPKGVAVSHRNVVRLVRDTDYARLGPDEVFLQLAPVSFDASTLEIWGPLLNGSRLALFPPGPPDLREIGEALERHGVTNLLLAAGLFHQMVESHLESLRGVRWLAAGGDVLSPAHVRRAVTGLPGMILANGYGPTESTTITTCYPMRSERDLRAGSVPIGRPIANTRVYLLDSAYQPVPVGVMGRLYAGGDGLARGYVKRPDLTAERFVPDPLSGEAGARLYDTGDLARWLPSGDIEFFGRADAQVKIRGFRIELGEIETVLAAHPDIEDAMVLAREDTPGDKRLAAYLVPAAGRSPLPAELRAWLGERLPAYMVPAAFVLLPELPLGPTGKVDRKALPAPGGSGLETEVSQERSPAEELLAGIWSSLLRVSSIGPQDSFFDLGGHSLLATQVVSRVREVFGVELPLRALFETPTLSALAVRIQEAGLQAPPPPPILPVPRGGELRASFAQERLWFLDRFGTDRASYNIPAAVRLEGRLDVPALAATLTEIVRRHESLRTTFALTGGVTGESQVLQVIAPPLDLPLPVVDLAGLPAEVDRLVREEARRVFDLQRGPVIRALLLRQGEREHTLLLSVHHIVADGWSIGVLVRELSALYAAFVERHPSPLPELPVQYADFAAWQRAWLQGEVLEAQLGWWRKAMAGAPAVIELPADRPRPPVQSARGGRVGVALPAELSRGLRELVRSEGATLFMALLAGFQALLARTTGRQDLPVGTPIANRNRAEVEDLIGFFVNTLVMRGDLSGDPSFRELLARSRESALGAYAHQDVPFEKLVEELRPERDLSHSPLFQAMAVLNNAPMEPLELPELTAVPLSSDSGSTKFDLRLALMQTPEGLAGSLVYNRDLFDVSTVERLAGYLETLLAAAVSDPGMPLWELPLLGEVERRQLLKWGDAQPVSEVGLLHRLFEAQVSDRTAVTCDGAHLTYRELDARANQIAHALIAEGVRPGDLVGLRLERSLDMVVAVLGVLKAGGAYLPLDPTYPEERLAFAIEDSQVSVVVTKEWLGRAEGHSPESPGVEVTPDFPAYVIYTSGSTGRPKGVVVTHANATRLFAATDAWFDFGPDDVWTLFHSYAFDFSVWELWGALLYGGRLVVVPYWVSRSPEAFYELVRDERVTVLNQTPSAFRQLIWAEQSIGPSDLALRCVAFGGEALELASLAPWYERHAEDRPRLVNMYGITETTVHVTYRPLSRKDVEEARGSVIGVPIPDLSLRILDRDLRLQPIGVPGEIHVGGEGLAMGYLGRPELTAERFVPDPFGPPGARLYRSGDLARYLADGDVEYLGRIDHQVKIRGFRIEPGEIETALTSQPEIREAVVMAREDKPGDKRLVAYLVGEMPGDLRERLKTKLPEYMIPAAFVTLPFLPLTANGKVDRKALPVPEAVSVQKRERVAPRTALERFLAELWPGSEVGIEDDFFELGGNSISGAILINRIQETLGEIVQVVVIFDAPTVQQMAAYLIENHAEAVARIWGLEGAAVDRRQVERVDEARVELMRSLVRPLAPLERSGPQNLRAVFVLAPPRSGTTLMRVLLGGHSHLFAPPELELLSYNTLAERKATYTGRDAFWLEGLVRAVMEVRGCTAEEATEILGHWEEEGWTSKHAYGQLQAWLGDRILVDKTPSYALDPAILQRAEEDFDEPLYVHLVRHPYAMIRSFEEAKLDQIFFRQEHPFERRELAELIWLISQENILRFLETVPAERRHLVHFEELVRDPEPVLRGLCEFLGLDFHPSMLKPYEDRSRRMTDGVHAESRMLGDVKFHTHSGIDASTAERWKEVYQEDFLGAPTARMAKALGYELPEARSAAIPRRHWQPGEPRPLSFSQQRLWFLDRLEPGSYAYNIAGAVRLLGPLDVTALAGSLGAIVRRHESLRTTFGERDGEPYQVIARPAPLVLPIVDLSGLPADVRETEARRVATAESRRAFDLARGPLARFSLLRLGEREHGLNLGMHHVVSDGWSLGIFVRELGELYRGAVAGEPAVLPDLPIQYSDYAAWQREWMRGKAKEESLSWWVAQLAGAPQVIDLPLDRPRPAVQSFRGDRAWLAIGSGLWERLETLSRRLGATPFMTLLAAWATLLHRYGSQPDVVVGTPIANRGRAELEKLIGFFANTLALRVDLSGDSGFGDLVRRVRERALGAYTRQEFPFERLVEELRPERSLSHAPVFQVALALQNLPEADLDLGEVTLSRLPVDPGAAPFDLFLFLTPSPDGGVLARIDYASDLFDPGTVERILGHLPVLLAGAVDEPERALSRLPLLTEGEQTQLAAWNEAERRGHSEGLLHALFEAQARRTPEAVALVAGGTVLTYAELEERSARLAAGLRSLGIGPEIGVAVCQDRTADLVVSLLGVLRSGGFYVPLDPRYPAERLRFLIEDSGARFVLTRERLAELIADPVSAPAAEVAPDNLAYLIYTSGSTGRPKAVAIEHRSAFVFAQWARESFSPAELRCVLASTAVTFDLSVFEIFVTLASGGTVVLVENALAKIPAGVEVTLVNTVPSAMAELLRNGSLPASVRTINLAGEALPRWLADLAYARPETARLCNLYGPSEDTTYSTWTVVERSTVRAPSIGRPVHDTRAYVVDPELERLPMGIPGELFLAGAGLARGYLGRPELTAERFLPDSFATEPGARMYRTGDLVRYRQTSGADGELDYLGRLDHQVKVRGFRIELGEVESALARQPGVESVVVLAREDVPGDKRLVAYVVASGGELTAVDLRRALERDLPDPMIPSAFVFLEALPLTPHGKVDRRSLPAPDSSRPETAAHFVAPRTPLEEEVARVWREVLGVDRIGVDDTFWSLGGHSLLATRVLSRIGLAFGVDLPLQVLFASPTLAAFAAAVGEGALAANVGDFDAALEELGGLSEEDIRELLEQEARELEELA
jgi:amino acid adenylation domain-containing protein